MIGAVRTTYTKSQESRWRELKIKDPYKDAEHSGHDTVWTAAPGIWHCRDCCMWYRTWADNVRSDERQ